MNVADSQSADPGEIKQEIEQSVENRIQELISNWQSEKNSLSAELENALTFWGKMQEKMTALSQDIGELKDREREVDPEVQEKVDNLMQNSVTRDDLRHLASQIRHELEEYVQKHVPAVAAQVIRDEIIAMFQEKRDTESSSQ